MYTCKIIMYAYLNIVFHIHGIFTCNWNDYVVLLGPPYSMQLFWIAQWTTNKSQKIQTNLMELLSKLIRGVSTIVHNSVTHITVKLLWIFPEAPFKFNGTPGNIQGNLTDMYPSSVLMWPPPSTTIPTSPDLAHGWGLSLCRAEHGPGLWEKTLLM